MSIKRVKDAAMLSSLAHLPEDRLKAALSLTDYKFNAFISSGFLQCYIATDNKDQVVVFRESTDKQDWIANIRFLPKDTSYGIFHHTFYDKLQEVRREILSYIKDKDFMCIGFSQGASLARLFAHIVTKREVLSGYKPFFVSFEPAMESKTNDYNEYGIYTVKGNDPVTILPFGLTGWNQSGDLIYFTGKKCKAIINPSRLKKSLLMLSDTILDFEDNFTQEDILRDHSIFVIKQGWEEEKNQKKIIKLAKSFGLK